MARLEFNNGSIYEGEVLSGEPHGMGKMTDSDGSVRYGYWEAGFLLVREEEPPKKPSSSSSSAPPKPASQHIVIKFAPSTSSGVIGKCPVCGTQMTPLLGGGKPFCYKCKNAKLNAREGIALIEAKQYEKAIPLLEESAACGNEQAMYNIGVCYYNGFGVKKDIKKSTEWIKKAADKGHEIAKDVINDIKINKIIFGVNLAGDLLETILSGLSE